MIKERTQNPVLGDTINLRLFSYSSNTLSDVYRVKSVKIFYLDHDQRTENNPDGRVLIRTVAEPDIQNPSDGEYLLPLITNETEFRVGSYIDRWEILFEDTDNRDGVIENSFHIYRDLWYTSEKPIIYDIGFNFQPYRLVQGCRKHLRVDLEIFAPEEDIIDKYYYYLLTLADIQLRIVQDEGVGYEEVETDKNVVLNWTTVDFRENTTGYYRIDTSADPRPHRAGKPWGTGIYLVQFRATLGGNLYLSQKFRIQIYS